MQGSTPRDWIGESGDWVPNYNNSFYLTRWNALHAAIANHLNTGSYQPSWASSPIPYSAVIQYIDIRGMGSWGEWHSYGAAFGNNAQNYPSGTFPTVATFKSIIDAHVNNYDDYQLVIITSAFDCMRLGNTRIPKEIAYYAYTQRTNKAFIGFRNDHLGDHTGDVLGDEDSYDDFYLQKNPNTFEYSPGLFFQMDTAFENRYRLAPFVGEPPGGPVYYEGVMQGAFPTQVNKWRISMAGNGNWGQGNTPSGSSATLVRDAWGQAGYHLRLTGGNAIVGSNLTINLKWRNFGLTPTYDHWNVEYSLRNGAGTTVWTSNSSFDPYLFLPDYGEVTKTDVYSLPAVPAGTYQLRVTVKDPENYMTPLPLQITGREEPSGSYFLANITINAAANQSPTVNAGSNQSIQLPDDDASLSGSASDPDGTIASYQWSQVSGPSTATITDPTSANTDVEDLIAGSYTFDLTVTDDDGATASDQVIVNVAPAVPPVANAGPNKSITLPTSSTSVTGSGTDDGSIVAYEWEVVSGPSSPTISSPFTATTNVSDLVEGVYVLRLTVTDNAGLTDDDEMSITVLPGNQAPVSDPGENQTIQEPDDDVDLDGSGSTDDVDVTGYAWTQLSGPNSGVFGTPSASTTTFSGLIPGVYQVRLTVTDGGGLTNSKTVQITVLAAPNEAPVAIALVSSSTITLPTSSVTLDGTTSTDDDAVSSYNWTLLSGPNTPSFTANDDNPTVTGMVEGVYTFRLTVTDTDGETDTDDVTVTVLAATINHIKYRWGRRYIP